MNVIKVNSATKQTLCNNPIEVHNMSRQEAIHRLKKKITFIMEKALPLFNYKYF